MVKLFILLFTLASLHAAEVGQLQFGIPPLLTERFEAPGYENAWTTQGTGTITPNYQPAISGSYSLCLVGSSQAANIYRSLGATYNKILFELKFKVNQFPTGYRLLVALRNGSSAQSYLYFGTPRYITLVNGSKQVTSTLLPVTNTTYTLWLSYETNGKASFEISTNGFRSLSGENYISIADGTSTLGINRVDIGPTAADTFDLIIDDIAVDVRNIVGFASFRTFDITRADWQPLYASATPNIVQDRIWMEYGAGTNHYKWLLSSVASNAVAVSDQIRVSNDVVYPTDTWMAAPYQTNQQVSALIGNARKTKQFTLTWGDAIASGTNFYDYAAGSLASNLHHSVVDHIAGKTSSQADWLDANYLDRLSTAWNPLYTNSYGFNFLPGCNVLTIVSPTKGIVPLHCGTFTNGEAIIMKGVDGNLHTNEVTSSVSQLDLKIVNFETPWPSAITPVKMFGTNIWDYLGSGGLSNVALLSTHGKSLITQQGDDFYACSTLTNCAACADCIGTIYISRDYPSTFSSPYYSLSSNPLFAAMTTEESGMIPVFIFSTWQGNPDTPTDPWRGGPSPMHVDYYDFVRTNVLDAEFLDLSVFPTY